MLPDRAGIAAYEASLIFGIGVAADTADGVLFLILVFLRLDV